MGRLGTPQSRDIWVVVRVTHYDSEKDLFLVIAERERIEEQLRAALETARASYRLSMITNPTASFHKEASLRFRVALERFHRFVLTARADTINFT